MSKSRHVRYSAETATNNAVLGSANLLTDSISGALITHAKVTIQGDDVLVSLTVVIIQLHICISNYHVERLK